MNNWQIHTGTERPAELAGAQIIEWAVTGDRPPAFDRADGPIPWFGGAFMPFCYRPTLDPDGTSYCSAEGLEPKTEYVCVDEETGDILQCTYMPRWEGDEDDAGWCGGVTVGGPETHRKPGPPAESLMRVWR